MRKSDNDQHAILILINPYCHQGRGWERWLGVRDHVIKSLGAKTSTVVLEKGRELSGVLETVIKAQHPRYIISAGGDGTVHTLVNALLNIPASETMSNVVLGAIGLGSSNDFLKPFGHSIGKVPVRINLKGLVRKCDVGLAEYTDGDNRFRRKYFIVNASLGVTASANWAFNHPDPFLKFLKSRSTGSAIVYTAIRSILGHKNIDIHLTIDTGELDVCASNVNILKIPYVSGQFRYNQAITPDDGNLSLNICRDMGRVELLRVLSQLSGGKFPAGEKTMSKPVRELSIRARSPVVFECDGETTLAKDIRISVVPRVINILTS